MCHTYKKTRKKLTQYQLTTEMTLGISQRESSVTYTRHQLFLRVRGCKQYFFEKKTANSWIKVLDTLEMIFFFRKTMGIYMMTIHLLIIRKL